MVDAKSLSTIAAPRQKEMKERATVVATTTVGVVVCLLDGSDMTNVEQQHHSTLGENRAVDPAESLARSIVDRLRSQGETAYFVGGCVRDLLLGIRPKDYDIATSATPQQVLELYPAAVAVGAHFGVVRVVDNSTAVEVATFRHDHSYADGRRPTSVSFTLSPEADVRRRDFTINALLLDPTSQQVIDMVGGEADLKGKLVRAIGEPTRRFEEDHLRMLRAVRFAARLEFEIDPATEAAIQTLASRIETISAERVRDELIRILTEGHARRGFELLDRTGLLQVILPEVARMKGVEQPPQFHPEGDVWQHTLLMLQSLPRGCSLSLALGVLLHDVGKPPTFRVAERIRFDGHVEAGVAIAKDIMLRLRFSNDEAQQVEALVKNHMRFMDAPKMRASTLKRFLRMEKFEEHLALHRLDCLSSNNNLESYKYVQARKAELGVDEISPTRLISGNDLVELGLKPGPRFAELLRALEDAQLEGVITNREDGLKLAQQLTQQVSE
jgi:putative nucleotidyltransferase with HDIG domain